MEREFVWAKKRPFFLEKMIDYEFTGPKFYFHSNRLEVARHKGNVALFIPATYFEPGRRLRIDHGSGPDYLQGAPGRVAKFLLQFNKRG
ncbi:MAG: hypothetical protein PHU81_04185 [Acidobacteriota bacterium]|nr:hypothetical protein [Acidobacteriota bacterium]